MCYNHLAALNPNHRLANCAFHVQGMETKYDKAKSELDELVANMEGL